MNIFGIKFNFTQDSLMTIESGLSIKIHVRII